MTINYENNSWELFFRMLLWGLAILLTFGLALPWVINSAIVYYSRGFTIEK